MSVINKGDTVLVTGVNSFVGSHVAEELIIAGFKVRGTSRTLAKAQYLVDHVEKKYGSGKIEIVEIPDMVQEGVFDSAVSGVGGIVHLASVVKFSTDPEELVGPSVKGAMNIFESAKKEPRVKSFVLTSSSYACFQAAKDKRVVVSKETFNEEAIDAAYKPNPTPFQVYAASKTATEKALWSAVKTDSPSFQVATVLPDANYGQPLKDNGNSTGSWITDLYNGKDYLCNFPPQWFVDVGDNAKLHVAALVDPACDGQRIFAFAEPYNCNDILAIFRKLEPSKSFIEDREDLGRALSEVPNGEAEELLRKHYGHGWTSLEESIRRNISPV